jgi:hypothetical protein
MVLYTIIDFLYSTYRPNFLLKQRYGDWTMLHPQVKRLFIWALTIQQISLPGLAQSYLYFKQKFLRQSGLRNVHLSTIKEGGGILSKKCLLLQ